MADDIRARYAPDRHADGRLVAPSAERNTKPIVDALTPILIGRTGVMLEVGAGTGQHSVAMASAFPRFEWQPSDPYEAHLESIRAWSAHAGLPNIREPIWLDAAEQWPPFDRLAGVFCANVTHISPWVVTQGIVRGAGEAGAGVLIFYGPFREGGAHNGEGNAAFDTALRVQDSAWGIRDSDDVADLAARAGFGAPEITLMPANNRLLVFTTG